MKGQRKTLTIDLAALLCVFALVVGLTTGLAQSDESPNEKLSDGQPVEACHQAPEKMSCIPGGPFLRGSNDGRSNARPQETVAVQTFYMDQYEVTVADYKACVKANKCKPARTFYRDYSRPLQPKVGVSWFHAVAFCKANGKHLPTEAEWEMAARGKDGRSYPWGNKRATCKEAVIKDRRGRSCGVQKRYGSPEKGRTFEVGSRPPYLFGLYDMAGNSWEWVYDWYSSSYAKCGDACRGVNPQGPCNGETPCKGYRRRVVRGGSWYWPARYARTFHRRAHFPENEPSAYHHFGFRCAASSAEATALLKSP